MTDCKTEQKHAKKQDIEAIKKELDAKAKEAEEYVNHLKRIQADFENFIKRTEKERSHFVEQANQKLLTEMLTILDDFESSLKSMREHKVQEHVVKGVEMIYLNLQKLLASNGVRLIESIGKKADPYRHEVILTKNDNGVEEDTIIEEIQKGYLMNDKVLRYAKVKVTKQEEAR